MSSGKHEYAVLTKNMDRNTLIELGKQNGVSWKEDKDEGINWMRFSRAMISHIDQGKPFETDNADPELLQSMKDNYHQLRDMHKQTMIPHIRAAIAKLHSEGDTTKSPMDYLPEAMSHLDANGGHVWSDKLRVLDHFNNQIRRLSDRLGNV